MRPQSFAKRAAPLLAAGFLLFGLTLSSCKKADNFHEKLVGLPQIDNSQDYAYKSSYIVGETMVIAGHLDPANDLRVTIGGQEAPILKVDTFRYQPSSTQLLQKVSVQITAAMTGRAREVKVSTGGYSTLGAAIDVYSEGGAGSFANSLTNALLATFITNRHVFLHCINGRGDVYYYSATDKKIRHIAKDGTETELYDLSQPIGTGGLALTGFVAGGLNPQGTKLYFSATTAAGYVFAGIDLQSRQLTVLNQSAALAAPYEGSIASVKMVVSGVYPDSKGNVYLALGVNAVNIPDAVASYSPADGKVGYLFKGLVTPNSYTGMPGSAVVEGYKLGELRFSPDEGILYAIYNSGAIGQSIELFDLNARVRLYAFNTGNATSSLSNLDVIAPFSRLSINITANLPDNSHGYLPMPGKRLQVLLFQTIAASSIGESGSGNVANAHDFPRWVVFDFNEQRTYAYAPGRFRQGSYSFRMVSTALKDDLLNYDEQGNLYTTANGRTALIKTQSL